LRPAPEQPPDVAHQQGVDRKKCQIAPRARDVLVPVARDAVQPSGVVPGKGVPERVRAAGDRELLALVQRKDDIREKGEKRRQNPEGERPGGNAQPLRPIGADTGRPTRGAGPVRFHWRLRLMMDGERARTLLQRRPESEAEKTGGLYRNDDSYFATTKRTCAAV